MKNLFVTFTLVFVLVLSCTNNSNKKALVDDFVDTADTGFVLLDTADMQQLSLKEYDLNLTIKVPLVASSSGTEILPVIEHDDGDYLWYIRIGEYFNLVIEDYAKEFNKVQAHEKELADQKDVFEITYLEKLNNLLFYKRVLINDNGGLPSYHCFGEITIDGYNYVLRSEKIGGYEPVITDMVQCIKTAEPITTIIQS
ncbi:MAG: hypothetical protein AB8B74_09835 [Crocinitomicaceae bacterium]